VSHAPVGEAAGRRPRVLHLGKYYLPVTGGIENHVASLCDGLAAAHDVTALVFNRKLRTRRETMGCVRVVRAGSLGRVLSTEIAPSFFREFLRNRGADLVHLHMPNPVGELACLALPRATPLVVTYHSDVVRQRNAARLAGRLAHRVLQRADRAIVFTRRYMESSPVLSRYESKCAIIPHGIDPEEMAPTPSTEIESRRLLERHGAGLVLFVGRLVYYKGLDVLLRAIARTPEAVLLIAGDGPLRGSLEALARTLGLGRRVVFLGSIPHQGKVAAMHASRLLVLPSTHRSEAFGLVQLEAMAARRPVICTGIDSGVPFVNQHGETGLVVPPGDEAALASAMRTLLDDEALCRRMGEAGWRRVTSIFSRDRMIRDCADLYDGLLARSRRQPVSSAATPEAVRSGP
jgi:rhamnosyl/mannosyltransferase